MSLRTVKKHGDERAVAIDVYRELRRSRDYVGRLEKTEAGFCFAYSESYLLKDNALSLGPDLPLRPEPFRSKNLFISFEDRLPSRRNPAYPEYCHHCNISPEEEDEMVLLSTIGRRGPSCLIFEGVIPDTVDAPSVKDFRQKLKLSIRGVCPALRPVHCGPTKSGKKAFPPKRTDQATAHLHDVPLHRSLGDRAESGKSPRPNLRISG